MRLNTIRTRDPCLRTSNTVARTRSLVWCDSPGICSLLGRIASALGRVIGRRAALVALDDAGDQLILQVVVFVEQRIAFGLADFLDHHLLGGLGGDALGDFAWGQRYTPL